MKKNKKLFFLAGTSLSLAFIFFTLVVREDLLRNWDFDMTVKLQDRIPQKFDDFFSVLSVAGRFEYTTPALVILLVFSKKIKAITGFVLFGFAHVLELIGKTVLEQPGPPHMFLRTHFTDFPGLHIHTKASYPSGHSLRIVFLAIVASFLIHKSRKLPQLMKWTIYSSLSLLVILMLISRVSLGEHWSTDVIGGTLLGAGFAFLSLVFL